MTNVSISQYVKYIGTNAFSNCTSLKTISVNSANSKYSSNSGILFDKEKTKLIKYPSNKTDISNYTVPNTVTTIEDSAFEGCSALTSIQLPNSITSIGIFAFYRCENLESINIPAGVTKIKSYTFEKCSSLKNITIPSKVTSIENSAFKGCSALTSMQLPNSLTSIGNSAFERCENLESINIPAGVTKIKSYTFEECSSLKNITIPSKVTSIENSAFEGCSALTSIQLPNSITSIGNFAFKGCSALTSIQLPNIITSIGNAAFFTCSALTSIQLPNSITSIGSSAFYSCENLESINIPTNITNIEDSTFSYCSKLSNITIPSKVTIIGKEAFYQCSALTSMQLPNTITSIGKSAFSNCKNLESINIPTSMATIENYTFYWCTNLNNINIPNNITKIGECAFSYCSKMTEFTIPATVTELGKDFWPSNAKIYVQADSEGHRVLEESKKKYYLNGEAKKITTNYAIKNEETWDISAKKDGSVTAIWNLESKTLIIRGKGEMGSLGYEDDDGKWHDHKYYNLIEKVNIEKGVTKIGERAFRHCEALNVVSIPNSVVSIGNEAFLGCGLENIDFPEKLDNIGEQAFFFCNNLTNINIPSSVTSIGKMAFSWCENLTNISVDNNNSKYMSEDGVLFTKEKSEIITCPIKSNKEQYRIPSGVKKIDGMAFFGCEKLKNINIPDTVVEINEFAFGGNLELVNINIPGSVTSIGDKAFYLCNSLKSIKVPDSVMNFGDGCFDDDTVIYAKSNSKVIDYAKQNELQYVIDDTAPVTTVSTVESANQSAIVKITSNEELQQVSGWTLSSDRLTLTKTYTENTVENIIVKDLVGNTSTVNVKVTNIDKTAPTVKVSYSTTELTNKNVVVTIKANEQLQAVSGWTLSADKMTLTKTYTANATENVTIKDLAGNTTTVTVKVANIEKTELTAVVTYSITELTNQNVVATIKANKQLQAISGWTLLSDKQTMIKTYTGNKTETVTIKDLAGNTATVTVKIANIDKTAPTAQVSYSTTELTNKNVVVTIKANKQLQEISGWTLLSDKQTLTKTYTSNTTETVTIKDLAGNIATVNIKITNIDRTAPIAQVSYSTIESTKQDVVVRIKANEQLQTVSGWTLSTDKLSMTKTYTSNTTETITIKDLAGNTTTVTIRVDNIDKTDPDPKPTPTFELKQYQIKDNYIVKIKPKTKYRDFIKDIETNQKYIIKEKNTEISGEDLIKTGQTLTTEDGHTYTLVVIGDLSGDGKIGIVELARISKIGSGKITDIKEIEKLAIDVNADGKINIIDLAAISKYAAE